MDKMDLKKYGITGVTEIVYNPSYDELFREETKKGLRGFEKGQETEMGAVNVMTGVYTGRSPKDKFFVMDETTKDTIWWTSDEYKNDNKPVTKAAWKELIGGKLSMNGAGTLGLTAMIAAYNEGEEWLEQLKEYLDGNFAYIDAFLKEHLPKAHMVPSEGTYLAWLDCRELGMTDDELMAFFSDEAKVWLDPGTHSGEQGSGFMRFNLGSSRSVIAQALDQIEAASRQNTRVTGVPTGFIDLDNMLTGLHGSELILVAARPAMGKTAFVLNIAHHVAVKKRIPVAIFSLEMSKEQLVTRMIALDSLVNSQKIQTGQLVDDEWDKIMESTEVIADAPIFVDDNSAITVADLRSKCRKLKQNNDLGLIIIDYLQLMSTNKHVESRQQFISDTSRALKVLARELNVPVIALSQLNRAVDSRPDHKPVLADLRESGAIEQDSDVVMFIYRDDYYNKDTDIKGIAEIIIAKQRNGPVGTVNLAWLGEYTKFANLSRQE